VRYFIDPRNELEEIFKQEWEAVSTQKLSLAKRNFHQVVKDRMTKLKEYMNDFKLCL